MTLYPPRRTAAISRAALLAMTAAAAVLSTGCPPRNGPLAVLSPARATAIVNENCARIGGTLRASGPVSGAFRTPDGRTRRFDVDGTLFFLAPASLRLDLKALGGTQMLLGSNANHYWYNNKLDGDYYLSRPHGPTGEDVSELVPVRPDQLIAALGLTPIQEGPVGRGGTLVVHRVEDVYQQVLFVVQDDGQRPMLQKEYWLDRRDPRLISRVVFRNVGGELEMESRLSNYRRMGEGGALLPTLIEARWPAMGATMRFSIRRWSVHPEITTTSPQFIPPHKLGMRFEREDIEE